MMGLTINSQSVFRIPMMGLISSPNLDRENFGVVLLNSKFTP